VQESVTGEEGGQLNARVNQKRVSSLADGRATEDYQGISGEGGNLRDVWKFYFM
jgi:hypothetical protein